MCESVNATAGLPPLSIIIPHTSTLSVLLNDAVVVSDAERYDVDNRDTLFINIFVCPIDSHGKPNKLDHGDTDPHIDMLLLIDEYDPPAENNNGELDNGREIDTPA